jgi:hypothetical protein
MGSTAEDDAVRQGVDWFVENQREDGLWPTGFKETNSAKSRSAGLWVTLAICRVLGRLAA